MKSVDASRLPIDDGSVDALLNEICPVIFDPTILPKRVNKADGEDLIRTSACNYYSGVSQREVEDFYAAKKTATARNRHGGSTLRW